MPAGRRRYKGGGLQSFRRARYLRDPVRQPLPRNISPTARPVLAFAVWCVQPEAPSRVIASLHSPVLSGPGACGEALIALRCALFAKIEKRAANSEGRRAEFERSRP